MNNQEEKTLMDYFSIEIEKNGFVNDRLTSNTHLRKKHLKIPDKQHVRRISDTKQTNHSSSFLSEEIMQEEIRACLRNKKNLKKLVNWLKSDKKELNLTNNDGTDTIGSGIEINSRTKRLTEYTAKTTEVRLMKDPSKPDGFAIITAFPILTRNITPTGRNVSHLIKDTKLYQNASKIEQVGMDIANDPRFDPKTMDIQTTKDKIRLQQRPCESEITYETVTYLPDEDRVRTTRPNLHQLAKNAAKKLGVKIQNIISQEQSIKTTKPISASQDIRTQIKEPEPNIPKPVQAQPNPITQSKTTPQDIQTAHIDRIKPDEPKIDRGEQAMAAFENILEKFKKTEDTDDFSL